MQGPKEGKTEWRSLGFPSWLETGSYFVIAFGRNPKARPDPLVLSTAVVIT